MRVQPGIAGGIELRATARDANDQDHELRVELKPGQAARLIWDIAKVLCPEHPADYGGPAARAEADR